VTVPSRSDAGAVSAAIALPATPGQAAWMRAAQPALRVELGHHVVEQQQRRAVVHPEQDLALGEQQREQGDALLPLRAERAQRAAGVRQVQLVPVRAVRGEAALDVGLTPLAKLGAQALGAVGARARLVRQLARLGQAELRGDAGKGLRQALGGLPARLHQLPADLRELAVPRVEQMGGAAGDERVALRQRPAVARPQVGQRRPQRRAEPVQVGAPQRGPAAHQLEALGQEDDDERPRPLGPEALDRRPVYAQALGLARLEAHLEQMSAVLSLDFSLSPAQLCTDPHQLTLVRGAAGARRQREVDALEQVGLAGAVRPEDDRQCRAEVRLGALVAAEVAKADPQGAHDRCLRRSAGPA